MLRRQASQQRLEDARMSPRPLFHDAIGLAGGHDVLQKTASGVASSHHLCRQQGFDGIAWRQFREPGIAKLPALMPLRTELRGCD
jgi:hypothetical protein